MIRALSLMLPLHVVVEVEKSSLRDLTCLLKLYDELLHRSWTVIHILGRAIEKIIKAVGSDSTPFASTTLG